MIRSSIEAQEIQRRFFKDKLVEDPITCTIISVEGRQRYFRAIEDGKDVFIRHNIPFDRFNKLNDQCTEFEATPNRYSPDTTRPFTKNDLLRSPTTREYLGGLIAEQAPGAVAGTTISAGAAIVGTTALVTLTPVGAAALAAKSLIGAKIVSGAAAGAKVLGTVASASAATATAMASTHPVATGILAADLVALAVIEEERERQREEERECEAQN